MVWYVVVLMALLVGCTQEAPSLPVLPPPEDLSTWSVPELIQPPTEPTPMAGGDPEPKPTPAEQVLAFAAGTPFTVTVASDVPLDVILERGEQVRNMAGGDRAPVEPNQPALWTVKEGSHGDGDVLQHHIFLTATAPGLTMGLIVTTTKRTYYLTCKSVKASPVRAVRWRYPADIHAAMVKPTGHGILPDAMQSARYHVGYALGASRPVPAWFPRYVVDDGRKTYIVYPEVTLFDTVPLVRIVGPNGPQLVNARQFLNVVILDQLLARAELRVGTGEHAEIVTITRGNLRTIACPGDEACPVWPLAAAQLAGRQP